MTIIEKIRAEIERRFIEYNKDSNHHLQAAEDAELLSFLDTLEESEKPEPFFYCKYGGIMPKCSGCKRNHSNSKYKTEDIENWFSPSERGTKRCSEYIPLQESEKPMNQDEVVINGHKVEYDKDKDAITMEEIQNDLEEAAKKHAHCPFTDDDGNFHEDAFDVNAYHDFIAGAKWMAEQLKK